jgi:hypothetical protein
MSYEKKVSKEIKTKISDDEEEQEDDYMSNDFLDQMHVTR